MDREQVLFRLFGKYCPEGTILYTEGSPGEELYVIQSGAVRIGSVRAAGGTAGQLGPGDLLGEESFFGRTPRAARAEVMKDARLVQVNDRTLDAVVRHGPQTALRIAEQLVSLTSSARKELTAWTTGQVLRRIAPHLRAAVGDVVVPADIAERSGLVENEVALALEELQRRNCLVREGTGYRMADAVLLQRVIDGLVSAGERA